MMLCQFFQNFEKIIISAENLNEVQFDSFLKGKKYVFLIQVSQSTCDLAKLIIPYLM